MAEDIVDKLYSKIDSLTSDQLDELGVGTIQLDNNGVVMHYNRFESELAKMTKQEVVGKNFFKEVAPCTDVQQFSGKFREGVANKSLYEKFRYRFVFKNQPPRNVLITMHYSNASASTWVFVQPVDAP